MDQFWLLLSRNGLVGVLLNSSAVTLPGRVNSHRSIPHEVEDLVFVRKGVTLAAAGYSRGSQKDVKLCCNIIRRI